MGCERTGRAGGGTRYSENTTPGELAEAVADLPVKPVLRLRLDAIFGTVKAYAV